MKIAPVMFNLNITKSQKPKSYQSASCDTFTSSSTPAFTGYGNGCEFRMLESTRKLLKNPEFVWATVYAGTNESSQERIDLVNELSDIGIESTQIVERTMDLCYPDAGTIIDREIYNRAKSDMQKVLSNPHKNSDIEDDLNKCLHIIEASIKPVSRKLDEELYDFHKKLYETSDLELYGNLKMYARHEAPRIAYSPDGKSQGYEYSYCKPVLDLIANLAEKEFPRSTIGNIIHNLTHTDSHMNNHFNKYIVKNYLKNYDLIAQGEEKFSEIAYRLDIRDTICKIDKTGIAKPELLDFFNEALEKSQDFGAAVGFMKAVQYSDKTINKNALANANKLLQAGVPYKYIKVCLTSACISDYEFKEGNIKIIAEFLKKNPDIPKKHLQYLRPCKDNYGILIESKLDMLGKIYNHFRKTDYTLPIFNICVKNYDESHQLYNSIVKLSNKIKEENFKFHKEHSIYNDIMKDFFILPRSLNAKNIEDFIEYAENENLNLKDYYSIFEIGLDEYNNFDKTRIEQNKRLTDIAFEKRDILKNGNDELTDENIREFFSKYGPEIANTVKLTGEDNFIYAYSYKMDNLQNMVEKFNNLFNQIKTSTYQDITALTNPEENENYKSRMIYIERNKKILNDKKSPEYKEIESITNIKIKKLAQKISEIKQTTKDTTEINRLNREIKQLLYELKQKKTPEIIALEKNISQSVKILREMKENSIKDPQEVIRFLNLVSALNTYAPQYGISKIIGMFPANTPEKKEAVNQFLSEEIFGLTSLDYDEITSKKLNLAKSSYLAEIFATDDEFKENFEEMLKVIQDNPDKSLRDAFNELPQNIETREQFEEMGIDYDKWVDVDKNSYVKVKVQTDFETAKQAAITNLETDFNDDLWKYIPKEESEKILDALKEENYELKKINEALYDADGYQNGTTDTLHFFKNGQRIEYKDLENIIKITKKAINENEFWTKKNNSQETEDAKNTIYNHLLKLRENEIRNTSKLRNDSESNIEVHKTDMNNISHSLFLGNQAHCCTAVGGGCNEQSAPTYIMNKMVSAIEVMDGKDFVGNSMCYIAKVDGVPALFLDNIELAPKYQFNDKIRDAIFEYAEKLCTEIGKPNMAVYAGPNRHKCNMPNETRMKREVEIIGSTGDDEIYTDFNTDNQVIEKGCIFDVSTFKIR